MNQTAYSYRTVTVCRDCGAAHVVSTDHEPRDGADNQPVCRSRNWAKVPVPEYGVEYREDLGKYSPLMHNWGMSNNITIHPLGHTGSKTSVIDQFADADGIDLNAVYEHVRDTVNDHLPQGWHWEPATSELHAPADADIDVALTTIAQTIEGVDIADDRWYR